MTPKEVLSAPFIVIRLDDGIAKRLPACKPATRRSLPKPSADTLHPQSLLRQIAIFNYVNPF